MEKVKKVFWKSLDFIYKHKVIAFLVAFTIATSFILYGVFANDDEFANQLTVRNAIISEIVDGTTPFNSNLDPTDGEDNSGSNGIVRNYDNVSYTVSYNLELKEANPDITLVENRNLIVDVIIPNEINATLSNSEQTGDGSLDALNLGNNYKYFEFAINNVPTTSIDPALFTFTLLGVNNNTPNTQFSPVVLIKEATDEEHKSIGELTDEEKEQFDIANYTNKVDCSLEFCTTTITGKYLYDIGLYLGSDHTHTDTTTNKTFLVGIGAYLPKLIGIYIPESISFNLATEFDSNTLNVSYIDDSFINYKDTNIDYVIYDENQNELPNILNNITFENNVVTLSNLKLSLSGGKYYIGTGSFEVSSVRGINSNKENSNITFKATLGDNIKELEVTDYYSKFVGAYTSSMEVYPNESVSEFDPHNTSTYLDVNQKFVLRETVNYATDAVGDNLNELDTFIKIDPDAFAISDSDEDNYITESNSLGTLTYAHGLWTSDYFELNSSINGCPGNISLLSKEQLMNLYGGPCLSEKETLIWGDNEDLPVIIVKAKFGDKTNNGDGENPGDNAKTGLSASIVLKGKVKRSNSLINTSHQITTLGVGYFGETNEVHYLHHLPNTENYSTMNSNNYEMAVYPFDTMDHQQYQNDRNICGYTINNPLCSINGTTIHIFAFSVNPTNIRTYLNDIERSTFYDYPIEWRISASASSSEEAIEFTHARLKVYVSEEVNYLYAVTTVNGETKPKEYMTDEENKPYKHNGLGWMYTFDFNEEEIENGEINTLSIFTDINMTTKSNTIAYVYAMANFEGEILDGTNIIRVIDARDEWLGYSQREVTLMNGSTINTYGIANPRYIEKDSEYTYIMKAYNNSSLFGDSESGQSFSNATLYYMLPYIEDTNYKIYKKTFTNTSFKVKINGTLDGYKAYYTTDAPKNVQSNIVSGNASDTTQWKEWTNYNTDVEATAIKIVKNTNWDMDTFFNNENGISVIVTPIKNAQADAYYNGFIMSVDRPSGFTPECSSVSSDQTNECVNSLSSRLNYYSSKSLVEVYNRKISGFVFEDYNYSDLFENGEDQMKDIVVELYKLNNTDYTEQSDSTNPNAYIDASKDELIETTTTDINGNYSFNGLAPGNYYVLFRYDGTKYTPCNKNGGLVTDINSNQYNSKAIAKNLVDNEAVSDIISLSSSSSDSREYINLGLRIRKEFAVEINKYITNIVQTSNQGTKTYDFDKATKVNIDIKNIKNTKFRVTYSFDIVNTKYFPGYIGIIADLLPNGMTFDSSLEENKDWTLYDGILYYTGLQNKLLLPGDKQYFKLVLDLDTNEGGTYTNIVAAQQPILMGEEVEDYDLSAISVETNETEPVGNSQGESQSTGADDNQNGNNTNSQGNGE